MESQILDFFWFGVSIFGGLVSKIFFFVQYALVFIQSNVFIQSKLIRILNQQKIEPSIPH